MPSVLQLWNLSPAPGSCPYAQRAWIALIEKDVQFNVLLATKHEKPEEFQQLYEAIWPEPQAVAKVPTIIDTDGFGLTESRVVVEYIESKYKQSGTQLIPEHPALAAKVRLFAEFFHVHFLSNFYKVCQAGNKTDNAEAITTLLQGIGSLDRFLRTHGTGVPFLLGIQYSFAEVMTASFLWRAQVTLLAYRNINMLDRAKSDGNSRFISWAQGVLDRPSSMQTNPLADVWVEAFKPYMKDVEA